MPITLATWSVLPRVIASRNALVPPRLGEVLGRVALEPRAVAVLHRVADAVGPETLGRERRADLVDALGWPAGVVARMVDGVVCHDRGLVSHVPKTTGRISVSGSSGSPKRLTTVAWRTNSMEVET